MTFSPLIIWAKGLFFFEQLFLVVARTWLESKSVCFFWAQNFGFWPKNPIFAIRPKIHVYMCAMNIGIGVHWWEGSIALMDIPVYTPTREQCISALWCTMYIGGRAATRLAIILLDLGPVSLLYSVHQPSY